MRLSILFLITISSLAAQQVQISPADQRIAAARKQVEANPKSSQSFNDLAFALLRKARDNNDAALYDQTLAAVDKSTQLAPANYDSSKMRVAALLGKHEYEQALKLAKEINHKVPDDVGGWAALVDVNVALGNYTEAETCAQWILDLRRGSALGFEKAAMLRELFGDSDGAIEFLDETMRRTSQNDIDQRAWLLMRRAHLSAAKNDAKTAATVLAEAKKLFPDSQMALGVEAEIADAAGAAALLEKRYKNLPSTDNLYEWAAALERAGQADAAALQFKRFETEARAKMTKPLNSNLALIEYYNNHKMNLAEALTLATKEAALRQDHKTLDAYAWCLYLNGKTAEAKVQMDKALAVGIRNANYLCHAAQIAGKACASEQPMAANLGAAK